jgi:uracil-DNA glycosylase
VTLLFDPDPPVQSTPDLEALLERLRSDAPETLCNFYADTWPGLDRGPDAAEIRVGNLRRYLAERLERCDAVLVGEAPGYQGARWSGIAFCDERSLPADRRTSTRPEGFREPSATIVNGTLDELGAATNVVKWNTTPWHPFVSPAEPLTNRAPRAGEIAAGREILDALIALVRPRLVIAVGNIAAARLPDAEQVRHPAYGGATQFRDGLRRLLR